jgi:hypothetical protein
MFRARKEIEMLGLRGLCGQNHVERSALSGVILPAQTETHTPIAHDYLADLIQDRLNDSGLNVINEGFVLARGGADMFGLFEVGSRNDAEFGTVVGFRNSHVKKLSAGLVIGRGVFVCDNLMFNGEIKFGRRHTSGILNDLGGLVEDAIGLILPMQFAEGERVEAYKNAQITDAFADHLIIEMLRNEVINTQRVEKVVAEWDKPKHAEHANAGNSIWRLEQATTEALKGTNVIALPERHSKLVTILDDAAEYEPIALAA